MKHVELEKFLHAFTSRGFDSVSWAFLLHISSSKMNRFMSNYDRNFHSPILHISSDTFDQQKCFVFVIICNYPGGLHLAVHRLVCC